MSLLKKTLLVVASTVIISTAAIYFASRSTLLQGYEKIERDDTQANVLRIVNSYYDQSRGIMLSARAYAVWDDMYNFVQEPKQEFLDYLSLTPELFSTHQANLIAILDVNYKAAFVAMYDLDTSKPIKIPSNLYAYLSPGSPLLKHTSANPEISGVILLDGRPMYIASLASLHTDFTGEPRGAVIFGRYLDEKVIKKLSETNNVPITAYLVDKNNPADVLSSIFHLNFDEQPVYVQNLSNDIVAGYTYVKTLEGQPAFVLKVVFPRKIYSEGTTSFYYFVIITALVGLVFIIVSTLLLRRYILFPLTRLSIQVSEIRASVDNSQRIEVVGDDELSTLGHDINDMLAVLEARTREMEFANKELDSFAYSVSHDLRAPLRAINGFTQIIVEDYGAQLDQEGQNHLLRVRENTQRMDRLIDDLLAFSRLSRQPLKKQIVQTVEIVHQALDELQPEYTKHQVEFLIGDLPECEADPSMLYQVFINLIGNAVKYTQKREKAEIEIGYSTGNGAYFVKDNGAGFDMQYADKLFGVFQRLHSSDEFQGTGVGLAITQRIIQRHGGKIWATAEVDKGATFFFTL